MMTNNDQDVGTVYWSPGQDDNWDVPVDLIKELEDWEIEQIRDMEQMLQCEQFDHYQDFTDSTAIYPPEKGLEYTALGLASEAGEFAGKVKKAIRDNTYDADAMAAELGDVLWYLARAAAELDYHLSTIAEMNVEKLKSRKEHNVIKGDGDDR